MWQPYRRVTEDDHGEAIIGILNGPASTPGQRSVNRFADFGSGVLIWFRGAASASVLAPLSATSDGTSLAFLGNDIAALAVARLGRSSLEFPNAQLLSVSFVDTTPYSHDGAQVRNRRHRLQLVLQGVETLIINGPLRIPFPQVVPVIAIVELQVEVWSDTAKRFIALGLVKALAHGHRTLPRRLRSLAVSAYSPPRPMPCSSRLTPTESRPGLRAEEDAKTRAARAAANRAKKSWL